MPPQNGHPAAFETPCLPTRRRGLNTAQKVSEAESALRIAHRIQDFAESNVELEETSIHSLSNPIIILSMRNSAVCHYC